MRRTFIVALVLATAAAAFAQRDPLEGRWEGTVSGLQGERPATATFRKEPTGYSGSISGPRGDIPFREVRLEGARVFASAEVQANVTVKLELALAGETLKGKADVEFGGQSFTFDYDLKRTAAGPVPPPAQAPPAQPAQRRDVPQPVQQQSREYFAGTWQFKGLARESALGPGGPREGTATFTPVMEGKFLEVRVEGKTPDGPYRERGYLSYDPRTKMLTLFQQRAGGPVLASIGDWSSPISIRFKVAPIEIAGQKVELRRTTSIVAAHSFNVVEELSVDGGPFERLGNLLFTRPAAAEAKGK